MYICCGNLGWDSVKKKIFKNTFLLYFTPTAPGGVNVCSCKIGGTKYNGSDAPFKRLSTVTLTLSKRRHLWQQSCSFLHFHRWHIWYYFNWHEIITFAAPDEMAHVLNALYMCLLKKSHQPICFSVMYRVNVVKRILRNLAVVMNSYSQIEY